MLKVNGYGQISVNVTKPGIKRGDHWHQSKIEKFIVVYGEGIIRIRDINDNLVSELFVNGVNLKLINIPPGSTHNIENTGITDLITIIWVNEEYNSKEPDTFPMEV